MQYTYKGQEYCSYLKEVQFFHPEIEPILRKPKDEITLGEASFLLSIPGDIMRSDSEALIKQELERQLGKTRFQLEADKEANPYIINNALLFLIEYGNISTLSVALELLSQSDDFLTYNKLGAECYSPIVTLLFALCDCEPERLQEFLLRDDVTATGKTIALHSLTLIGSVVIEDRPKEVIHQQLLNTVRTLLTAYLADIEAHRISNKQLLSHLVDTAASSGLEPLGHEIMPLFPQGLIDETIINEEDADAGLFNGGWEVEDAPSRKVKDRFLAEAKEYFTKINDNK